MPYYEVKKRLKDVSKSPYRQVHTEILRAPEVKADSKGQYPSMPPQIIKKEPKNLNLVNE